MLRSRKPGGVTLVELLVILAIIAVLLALLLPAVQKVRAAAARITCANNLKQVGLALHAYHDTHKEMPPGVSVAGGTSPQPFLAWTARLLPYLEQEALWAEVQAAYAQNRDFLVVPPHTRRSHVVNVFTCPLDARMRSPAQYFHLDSAFTAFLGVEGTNQYTRDGVLYLDSRTRLTDVTDGTSNTLAAGERPPSADGLFGWWYAGWGQAKVGSAEMVLGALEQNVWYPQCPPGPYRFGPGDIRDQCAMFHFWSLHPGGAHFLFADGSVRFLSYGADSVLPALATRAGGEAVSAD